MPINFIYLNCLIHTACMNLFCLKNIEITTCNNYYIYYTVKCTSDFHIYARDCCYQCFKPSSLVKTSRRAKLGFRNIHHMSFKVIWLVCCKFSYSFQVMIVYCISFGKQVLPWKTGGRVCITLFPPLMYPGARGYLKKPLGQGTFNADGRKFQCDLVCTLNFVYHNMSLLHVRCNVSKNFSQD
jgi:hypothetical protein